MLEHELVMGRQEKWWKLWVGGGKVGGGEMLTEGVGIWVAECQ